MLYRMTRLFIVLVILSGTGLLCDSAWGQFVSSRSALAAKQHLKTAVEDAMADGKITKMERAEILAEAKDVLTVTEYEGLKATMDRLSPPESTASVAKRSANERAYSAAKVQQAQPTTFISRMASHVPYIDDLSIGPHPQMSKFATGIPYAKSPEMDLSGTKQAVAKVSRLSDTYLERPSIDRPVPKVSRVEKRPASETTPLKTSQLDKRPIFERQPRQRYADESISPVSPEENDNAQANCIQQPNDIAEEMNSVAKESSKEGNSIQLVIPTGVLLPDGMAPLSKVEYSQPESQKQLEPSFLR